MDPLTAPPTQAPVSTSRQSKLADNMTAKILAAFLLPPAGMFLLAKDYKKGLKKIAPILAATIVGLAGYWYLIAINNNSPTVPIKKFLYGKNYNTIYGDLESVSLQGPQAKTGISFSKPVEFKQTSKIEKSDSVTASYVQLNDTGKSIGFLTVSSLVSPLAHDADYKANMANLLAQGSGANYDKFISTFYSFVKASTSSNFNVTLSKPVAFTNPNVKNDAWQFDVKTLSGPNDPNRLTPLQGKFIVLIGDKSFYYFGLYTLSYNWQSNDLIWAQVEKSIQINQ